MKYLALVTIFGALTLGACTDDGGSGSSDTGSAVDTAGGDNGGTDGTDGTNATDGTDATSATDGTDATSATDGTDATSATDGTEGTDGSTGTDATDGGTGDPTAGKTIYDQSCSVCHGATGQGGLGPAMTQVAKEKSDQDIGTSVTSGVPPTMPPFALTDAQLTDLIAYIRQAFGDFQP